MEDLKIHLTYWTLFSRCSDPERGCSLERGIEDLRSQAKTLEILCKKLPQKEKFEVHLGNCETYLLYVCPVKSKEEVLANAQEVLSYVFTLPKEHRPRTVFVENYHPLVEDWLRGLLAEVGKSASILKGAADYVPFDSLCDWAKNQE